MIIKFKLDKMFTPSDNYTIEDLEKRQFYLLVYLANKIFS